MHLRLATKFSITIIGVLALSLLSNAAALFAAWRVSRRLEVIATGNLPIAAAAEEFKAALFDETALLAEQKLENEEQGPLAA